ncbi:NAD(P)/FAD-dependent oxidoreductase [Neobacillus drentensis]|uniref:flavin-containing monooxygenase n=1 Tax=Neobacillus drentensis TaxID=220684 RepID=UPI0030008BC6
MIYNVAVIGAGQAGLAMGYYLKQTRLSFVILDKGSEIGESWKERYDSLKLFTPRSYSSLPGLSLEGEQNIYPTKNEISDYLIHYTNTFSLPIQLNTTITKLAKVDERFKLSTNQGEYQSKNVIIATGPFQQPYIPNFSKHLSGEVLQLHSSEYKNSSQLIKGTTVIVGGGNSGAQIAVELSHEGEVFLSVGHRMTFLPQDIGNKSIFWWFDKLGIYKANVTAMPVLMTRGPNFTMLQSSTQKQLINKSFQLLSLLYQIYLLKQIFSITLLCYPSLNWKKRLPRWKTLCFG